MMQAHAVGFEPAHPTPSCPAPHISYSAPPSGIEEQPPKPFASLIDGIFTQMLSPKKETYTDTSP